MTRGILLLCLTTVCAVAALETSSNAADRHPDLRCVYPEDVFLHAGKGGRVIDVTEPPFNAKGDGVTDDTAALVRAYDFVLGGICNEHGSGVEPETPIMRNVDSSLCYVGYTNGPNRFETIVEETIQGETRRLKWEDLPSRPGTGRYQRWKDVFVPLYVSGKPATR